MTSNKCLRSSPRLHYSILKALWAFQALLSFPVVLSRGSHPFPSRTRKLSLSEPMVLRGKLRGRVGRRRINFYRRVRSVFRDLERAFFFSPSLETMAAKAFGHGLRVNGGRPNATHATTPEH